MGDGAVRILDLATEVLADGARWTKGGVGRAARPDAYCVLEAVWAATAMVSPDGFFQQLGFEAAVLRLGRAAGVVPPPNRKEGDLHPVAVWNDRADRTWEDVALALKRAVRGEAA